MDNSVLKTKKVLSVCMETTAGGRNYSGGLGALYGDTTRTMYRLGADFIAVTPIYQNGYVHQRVTAGAVYDEFPAQDHNVDYEETGISFTVPLIQREIKVKIWRHKTLKNAYGVDTNLPENGEFAKITNNLYGEYGIGWYNGEDQRLMQEVILGVAAVKLCDHIGYHFDIIHLNEGHGVFAAIYIISQMMKVDGVDFYQALHMVKGITVFTTHTPIMAGNKSRPIDMIMALGANLGLTRDQIKYIGAFNENDDQFGSTVAALRVSKIANAVAFRHQATSRDLWKEVKGACPITYIDNGVDLEYWQDKRIKKAYDSLDFDKLLESHYINKGNLISAIKKRNGVTLDSKHIIIGFARRAIAYKRWDLVFHDLRKFEELIKNYNIQFVFSGKTHPKDEGSKQILTKLYRMSERYPNNVVFIQDYDVEVAGLMTKGCDVWMAYPEIPLEACSTSGMKAAANGVLNLSTPDGWWYRSCRNGVNGWAFGEDVSRGYDKDSQYLYETIENEVMPAFEDASIWTKMMYASIYTAEEECSTDKMCRDYYTYIYNAKYFMY